MEEKDRTAEDSESIGLLERIRTGTFGERDYAKVVALSTKGNSFAMLAVGEAKFLGAGTKRDDEAAWKCFDAVIADGSFEALAQLAAFLADNERGSFKGTFRATIAKGKERMEERESSETRRGIAHQA